MPLFSSKHNQSLSLNGLFISGLQSLSINAPTNINPSLAISDSNTNYIVTDQNKAAISLEYIPNSIDPLISATGLIPISGSVIYTNKYFDFNSGYLSNYNLRAALDSPIYSKVDIDIYGKFAEQTGSKTNTEVNYNLNPYSLSYIGLNLNEVLANRLTSFSLSIRSNKIPQYNIGEYYPTNVLSEFPIKIDFDFELELDEYNLSDIRKFLFTQDIRSLTLDLKKYSDGTNIISYSFSNLIKNTDSLNFNVNDNGKNSLSFSTYILS